MVPEKYFDFCQNALFEVFSQNPQYEPSLSFHRQNSEKSKMRKNGYFFVIF